jgi:Arc/MetJ family transcription regulator
LPRGDEECLRFWWWALYRERVVQCSVFRKEEEKGGIPCDLRLDGFLSHVYLDSMKTTIDIPDAALADAMRFTGAKTKREAVVKALEEYNRQQLVKEVVASFGTWDIATNDEIEAGDMEEIASGKPRTGIRTVQ